MKGQPSAADSSNYRFAQAQPTKGIITVAQTRAGGGAVYSAVAYTVWTDLGGPPALSVVFESRAQIETPTSGQLP